MGIREHQQPQVTSLRDIRAGLADRANNLANSTVVPGVNATPGTQDPGDDTVVCPTCHGQGRVTKQALSTSDDYSSGIP